MNSVFNLAPIFVFTLAMMIWLSGELYVTFKKTNKDAETKDKGSSALLEWGSIGMVVITYVLITTHSIGEIHVAFLKWTGFLFVVFGVLFRQYSIYVLGQFFNGYIRVRDDHQLIQHGPYKYFRHPSYFGSVLSYLGMGLASSHLISIFLLPIGIAMIYVYRTKVEEKVMEDAFGEVYTQYKKKTWGFLPFQK